MKSLSVFAVAIASAICLGACGSSSGAPSSNSATGASTGLTTTATTTRAGKTAGSPPGALSAEAQAAATGDIPDNQVFLVLNDARAGYSMKYPEGWTIQGGGSNSLTIRDKNNLVRVVVRRGPAPSPASVDAALRALKRSSPTLAYTASRRFALPASPQAVKSVYTTESAPNAVTGKRVKLIVDRYVISGPGGRVATVDLGTPQGVDNVDAYRMMIQSFTWK